MRVDTPIPAGARGAHDRPRWRRALALGGCCALLAASLPARAEPTPPATPTGSQTDEDRRAVEAARRYNEEAEKLFNLGLFEEAAATYQKAYVARRIPAFLYNIGQCYRRFGGRSQLEKAVFYYEAFLNDSANADPARSRRVEEELVELKRQIEELRAQEHRPPPVYKRWWFWTAIAVAIGGATTGLVLGLRPADEEPVSGNVTPEQIRLP